ncbi:hypothetical protein [Streptomyces sp. NPDC101249]|uniref:hypothetical protein n=1 Tax=Streptomyces sp. NPDC101249 TaxID=3366140 RepID=UPI003821511C
MSGPEPPGTATAGPDASVPPRGRAELARAVREVRDGPVGDACASFLLAAALLAPDDPHAAETAVLAAADAAWAAGDAATCLTVLRDHPPLSGPGTAAAPLLDYRRGVRLVLETRFDRAAAPRTPPDPTTPPSRCCVRPRRPCSSGTSTPPGGPGHGPWRRPAAWAPATSDPAPSNTSPTPNCGPDGTRRRAVTPRTGCGPPARPDSATPPPSTTPSWRSPPPSRANPRSSTRRWPPPR